VEDVTAEQAAGDLLVAVPNLLLSAVLLVVVAVTHRESMRLPDRVVLPGVAGSVAVLAVVAVLAGEADVAVRGLVGGAAAFAVLFAMAFAQPHAVGFGTVKAAALVGVPAGLLGPLAWLTGFAGALLVGLAWARLSNRRLVPTSVLLLVWLAVAVLTPWLHVALAAARAT
jgi:leader peptidase (prepilin peptidase)/N-methyltransferase